MERIKQYLKWLANIIPQAKSIVIMKEVIFAKEEAVMRAIIYLIQALFVGIVLISVVDYFGEAFGIENGLVKNIIFVVLYSLYISSNIFGVILQIDEMKEDFESKESKYKQTIEEINKEKEGLEELLIACRYNNQVCEKRLKKFQMYFENMEPIFISIQNSPQETISKRAILSRYREVKESFDRISTDFISFEDFRKIAKKD